MYFSFDNILPVVWIALGATLVLSILLLTLYRRFITVRDTVSPDIDIPDSELPGMSVVVYSRDDAEELQTMLETVLTQDYPQGKLDVIVVNDGSAEDVTDVVNLLSVKYRNLYITFVPQEAHNLSRKKLAISLGVKASKREVILLTTANSTPASDRWARLMAYPFTSAGGKRKVVLGWGKISGIRSAMLRFDQVARAVTWLSAVLHMHLPYRGTRFNLAYRRDLFFEAKGFSRTLNLNNGDDDIFISQIATPENTGVVVCGDATVDIHFQNPEKGYRDLRLAHCFTERRLTRKPRLMMGFFTLLLWLWVAAVATGIVFSLPNIFPALIFILLIPALLIPLTITWRRTAATLGLKLPAAGLWWMMLWRWIPVLRSKISCSSDSRKNFTWDL